MADYESMTDTELEAANQALAAERQELRARQLQINDILSARLLKARQDHLLASLGQDGVDAVVQAVAAAATTTPGEVS